MAVSFGNMTQEKLVEDNIKSRTLLISFLRMSSKRKMAMLTKMFQSVRNLRTLADILNTFVSVNTKLMTYSKISSDSNSSYEQFVQDHDRMLDQDALEEMVLDNTEWFTTLGDAAQTDIITSFMRLSGGSIIKKMYTRLIKIFNTRSAKGKQDDEEYKSKTSMIFPQNCEERLFKFFDFQPRYVYQDEESDYNPDSPTNKKVVEARKQWQATMAKLRKDIEAEIQKLNEPILDRIAENQASKLNIKKTDDSKNGKDNGTTKKTAKSKTQEDTDIDWVQFLPVWNVKKIFAYLDEKTLYNLRNVNDYWATISKEVLAEKKARDYLDSVIKKSEEFLDNLLDISPARTEVEIEEKVLVSEPSGYKKRKEKQRRTATSIRRKIDSEYLLHSKSVLSECFKEFDTQNAMFLTKLKSFPTGIPNPLVCVQNESTDISLSNVASIHLIQDNLKAEPKSPHGSEMDKVSSTASIMSLVPSIVVSVDDMQTW
ncbi:uncharacterized protein LOC123683324 isoform X2 [Harmonia axyridis]|uniref:uncharacterized protein LOC123683324 isoform X2 n=1 Tax=Harmonia axyridis TaxID=115357 RepID=UPI001E2774E0|nr:uncharacterized protein LOC123683324 isoform X2 [Harmonia axyridis]